MKKIKSISCEKKIRSDPNSRVQSEMGDLGHLKKLDPFHSCVKKIRPISCVKKIRLPYSIAKTI